MRKKIDQSGRVEFTSHDTVVAYANDRQKSIKIKAVDKRKLQQLFREAGKNEMFVYKTFTALIYLLTRDDLEKTDLLIIDREYPGHEDLIKNLLLQYMRKHGYYFDPEHISFGKVGKGHNAA